MTNLSIWYQIGRLEVLIKQKEKELEALKEIHKDLTEIGTYMTLKKIEHEGNDNNT